MTAKLAESRASLAKRVFSGSEWHKVMWCPARATIWTKLTFSKTRGANHCKSCQARPRHAHKALKNNGSESKQNCLIWHSSISVTTKGVRAPPLGKPIRVNMFEIFPWRCMKTRRTGTLLEDPIFVNPPPHQQKITIHLLALLSAGKVCKTASELSNAHAFWYTYHVH